MQPTVSARAKGELRERVSLRCGMAGADQHDAQAGWSLMDEHMSMAARFITASMNDTRDELAREIDHSMNPVIAMTDSLTDIAQGALREWALG